MIDIRPYHSSDLDALYRICLATAAAGDDASGICADPRLPGEIFAAPYAVMCPKTIFLAVDAGGIAGYVVGTADSFAFEASLEAKWWPQLRRRYEPPADSRRPQWNLDERLRHLIHRPSRTPPGIGNSFPAHLHINLLPRLRGKGAGRALLDRWFEAIGEAGSPGAHLAVGESNIRAVRFYRAYGFRELQRSGAKSEIIWFGLTCSKGGGRLSTM